MIVAFGCRDDVHIVSIKDATHIDSVKKTQSIASLKKRNRNKFIAPPLWIILANNNNTLYCNDNERRSKKLFVPT